MFRLRDMPMGRKLYSSFGVVVVLLAVVAGVSLWAQATMGQASRSARAAARKAEAAGDVRGLASYIHESQTRFVLTRGVSYQDHLGDVRDFKTGLAALAADSTGAGDQGHLRAIRRAYAGVASFDRILIRAVRAGRLAAATAIVEGGADEAADALTTAASSYQASANREQAAADSRFASTRSLATWLVGLVSLVAALLAGVFAFLVGRGITRGLRPVLDRLTMLRQHCVADLKAGLEALATGDLTVAVTPITPLIENPSHDEIGQTAEAVNAITTATVASVEAYNRMRDELSVLVARISEVAASISAASQDIASTSEDASRAVGEIAAASGRSPPARSARRRWWSGPTPPRAGRARRPRRRARWRSGARPRRPGVRRDGLGKRLGPPGHDRDPAARGQVGADRRDRRDHHGPRRSDQPACAERRHRGRPGGRPGPRLRRRCRGGAQARRAVPRGRGPDRRPDRRDPVRHGSGRRRGRGDVGAHRAWDGHRRHRARGLRRHRRAVRTVTSQIHEIAAATSDVASVADQTSAATEQVSASTEETTASAQELAASAHELATTAATLEQLVAGFKTTS